MTSGQMKVVYVMTESLSNYRTNLPDRWNPRMDWSYPAAVARQVALRAADLQIECWRPERLLNDQYIVRNNLGITYRAFPSRLLMGHEFSKPLLDAVRRVPQGVIMEVHGIYGQLLSYLIPLAAAGPLVGQSHWSYPRPDMSRTWRGRLWPLRLTRHWIRTKTLHSGVLQQLLERRAFARYSHVFATNCNERDAFRRLCPGTSVSVRPVGIDFNVFQPMEQRQVRARVGLPATAKVVLYVGRLEQVKGLQYLIDSMTFISETYPTSRLVIIGMGGLKAMLQSRADSLGLSARVHFLGHLTPPGLSDWYAAADVLVLPSLGEGSPGVCKESMACGTPVVATDVGGTQEIVDAFHCGVIIRERDARAIADGVGQILRQPEAFKPDIANGRAVFGWETVVDERLELYRRLSRQFAVGPRTRSIGQAFRSSRPR